MQTGIEGNPLIRLDPTGHDWFSSLATAAISVTQTVQHVASAVAPAAVAVLDATTGIPSMIHDVQTIFSGNASTMDKVMAGADLLLNVAMDVSMVVGVGEGLRAAYVGAKVAGHVAVEVGEHVAEHAGEDAVEHVVEHEAEDAAEHAAEDDAEHVAGDCLSFTPDTPVAVPDGKQVPIATLKVGDKVLAYDPQTRKAGVQTVEHTSINHEANLLDVTLRVTGASAHSTADAAEKGAALKANSQKNASTAVATRTRSAASLRDEVVQTTTNHPWLTIDHGWLPASFLHLGEPVLRADGTTATVVAVKVMPGAADMWDLTVSNVHTFAVGIGHYVVHNYNCDSSKLSKNLGGYAGDGKQAHHLIPCECKGHDLVKAAGNLWNHDGARNGLLMFDNEAAAKAAGQAYHYGSHPNYTRMVEGLLDNELAGLGSSYTAAQASSALDRVVGQAGGFIASLAAGTRLW